MLPGAGMQLKASPLFTPKAGSASLWLPLAVRPSVRLWPSRYLSLLEADGPDVSGCSSPQVTP